MGSNYSLFIAQKESRIILTNREKITLKLEKLNDPPKREDHEIYSDDDESEEILPNYCYYLIKGVDYEEQLDEICNEFKIAFQKEIFFTRCLKCNKLMKPIDMSQIEEHMFERIKKMVGIRILTEFADNLTFCVDCKRTFWSGWSYEKCLEFAKKHSYHE